MKRKSIFWVIILAIILLGNIVFANVANTTENEISEEDLKTLTDNSQQLKSANITGSKTVEEGVYKIAISSNENIVVDISGASKDNQANANLWEYKGEIQQKFKLEYDNNGSYVIRNANSGKVLDVEWGGMTSGTNVWQYEYNGSDSQKWIIQKTSDGYYNIISKLNGLYLDFENGSKEMEPMCVY